MTKVLLRDVALRAGVSTALVSYVLNNQKVGRISKDAEQRIRAAVKELGYRPNQLAQSLKRNRTFSIGLIVADIANPFSSALARIISDEAERAGYTLIIGSSDESKEKSEKLINNFRDRQVDGFIIAAAEGTEDTIKALHEQNIPLVLIDRLFPGMAVHSVTVDNYDASYKAAQYLARSGKQRIGIVAYDTSLYHLQERVRGANEALVNAGFKQSQMITVAVKAQEVESDMRMCIAQLKNERVDAIFFTSNKLGVAGLRYLNAYQLHVPEDVSVVMFDDSEAFEFFPVALTLIRQPLENMGQTAVKLLLDQLGEMSAAPVQLMLETVFVTGESVSFANSKNK
ncbi:LacI family DNA-binding transcriptional regulator [Mucilaginibacter paludis]|uniref:Transcriptional regulator, LacI family n=1 Tax=Mucilaginibacter paludis DSM 18603 TaxID=714943 RepID=H1Y271_9SPHI|nr:substrate-binding domain-containing protein [Mucilaginibacter paludis]EHQ26728.1 transcriptional regulator, LacI family [Mucilaginibacter paludis DSM 18603]